MAGIYRDMEEFFVRIHDLTFAETFIPYEKLTPSDLAHRKVKIFPNEGALNRWAAGKIIKFVKGNLEIPDIWYVRQAPSKYDPCTIAESVQSFLLAYASYNTSDSIH